MANVQQILSAPPPESLADARKTWPDRGAPPFLPRRDWRDEVFYFLLPDRFSDGNEASRKLLVHDLTTAAGRSAIAALRGPAWSWHSWCVSGATRYQGGTLKGIESKLGYLQDLGVSALWIAPVFRQRVESNDYHGYGVQNFLEIDARLGSRADLVRLVEAAHRRDMRVVLDVIFNHSGSNWLYDAAAGNAEGPRYLRDGAYDPIWARSGLGSAIMPPRTPDGPDDWVYPTDLRENPRYLRAGSGSLGAGDLWDDHAEHKRTDFCTLRKFNLWSDALESLVWVYHYWMALTDVDGFRIDTLKHVTFQQARDFCNAITEYAETLGKDDFFLMGEVAGGNAAQQKYLSVTGRNLDACLDIGEQRLAICEIAKGLGDPSRFFDGYAFTDDMGSKRNWGSLHVSIANDHDHVFGEKVRLAADAPNDHRAVVAVALQLFGLGIPCLYYGIEQNLAGGFTEDERKWFPSGVDPAKSDGWSWGGSDFVLREAMFGPEHPRAAGFAGLPTPAGGAGTRDATLPGYGPHGTAGHHAFDPSHPMYTRIQALATVRREYKPLRRGRQYRREISVVGGPFVFPGAGELLAWSRVFDDQEVLIVVNPNGAASRGGRVVVDRRLSTVVGATIDGMLVVANTDPQAAPGFRVGDVVTLALSKGDSSEPPASINVPPLGASEVMVLVSRTAAEAAGKRWP